MFIIISTKTRKNIWSDFNGPVKAIFQEWKSFNNHEKLLYRDMKSTVAIETDDSVPQYSAGLVFFYTWMIVSAKRRQGNEITKLELLSAFIKSVGFDS